MKKTIASIAVLISLTLLVSAYSSRAVDGMKGSIAPDFSISNADTTVTLGSMRGNYVMITFWSSADAQSRIDNLRYASYAENSDSPIAHLAVNYDRNAELAAEIIRRDGVEQSTQFFDKDGMEGRIYADYHLGDGYMTCLIDPAGKIIAVDPTTDYLNELLAR